MQVRRIAIQAFRSLYDVEITPKRFNVLVGPNNAGKTNVVEAFDFLGDIHRHGLEVAVARKGGYENVAHRRMRRTKHPIVFDVEVRITAGESDTINAFLIDSYREMESVTLRVARDAVDEAQPAFQVQHQFEIRASGQTIRSDFAVASERLNTVGVWNARRRKLAAVTRIGSSLEIGQGNAMETVWQPLMDPMLDTGFASFLRENLAATDLAMSKIAFWNSALRDIESHLGAMQVFQLTPIECRQPGILTPNPELERHGRNLPAVVDFLQRNHPEQWKTVTEAMRRIVPGLQSIETDYTHDRRLILKFVEVNAGRPWSSEEVSDGTMQSLAMFCALFDPRAPLVLIEEPENSVHPWIVRVFVDACRAVQNKQVFITTHSPALIDYLDPAEVMLVWRKEGRTHVKPLDAIDPQARPLWKDGTTSLFDLLDSGWLEESVPEGYR